LQDTNEMSQPVLLDRPRPGVARITLNRPERLNAIDEGLMSGMYSTLDQVDADPAIRTVVLTGAGRGFCAGMDLKGAAPGAEVEGLGPVPSVMLTQQRIANLVAKMRRVRKPIIAAVNGPAAGGGLAFVLGSDVRIAAASARFNAAFVKIGLSGCDVAVSWILPRLVGAGQAHLMMLTGRLISADEAFRTGLVAEVVPDEELMDAVYRVADEIAASSPFGVWMTKEVMWSSLEIPSQQAAIDLENRTQVLAAQTADSVAARESFLTRTTPDFRFG
jgi:enoyl-CoA hydratase